MVVTRHAPNLVHPPCGTAWDHPCGSRYSAKLSCILHLLHFHCFGFNTLKFRYLDRDQKFNKLRLVAKELGLAGVGLDRFSDLNIARLFRRSASVPDRVLSRFPVLGPTRVSTSKPIGSLLDDSASDNDEGDGISDTNESHKTKLFRIKPADVPKPVNWETAVEKISKHCFDVYDPRARLPYNHFMLISRLSAARHGTEINKYWA